MQTIARTTLVFIIVLATNSAFIYTHHNECITIYKTILNNEQITSQISALVILNLSLSMAYSAVSIISANALMYKYLYRNMCSNKYTIKDYAITFLSLILISIPHKNSENSLCSLESAYELSYALYIILVTVEYAMIFPTYKIVTYLGRIRPKTLQKKQPSEKERYG